MLLFISGDALRMIYAPPHTIYDFETASISDEALILPYMLFVSVRLYIDGAARITIVYRCLMQALNEALYQANNALPPNGSP